MVEEAERADGLLDLAPEEHVGRGGEVVAEGEVLVDDLDPLLARVEGPVEVRGLALQDDVPGARGVVPGDDLDEGGLARPVVAHEAHDLPGADVEIDVLEGLDGPEVLRDAAHFENGHAWASPPVTSNRQVPPASAGAAGGSAPAILAPIPPRAK